ncbi:hypothetical protein BTVI_97737 [Pitangus sulphuratus]|nr:hypothetical protein BTVI_97737 [Pitangus sulphuratus]
MIKDWVVKEKNLDTVRPWGNEQSLRKLMQKDEETSGISGLPREAVAAPGSLEVSQARLDGAWSTLGWWKESIRRLVYLSWIFPSEEVDSVEVIPREVKAKAGGCGGSSSDSDSEDSDGSAPWDHNYTRREVLSRAPPAPGTPHLQYSENTPCEATPATDPAPPEPAGAEEHTDLAGDEDLAGDTDSGGELLSPFPELSCHCPAGQSSPCFTINLQTVLLGSLEERGDSPAAALPAPQLEGHWHCAHALEAEADTETVQKAPGADDFQEWQNSPSEEESDSDESDTDQGTGYMRRR